VRSEGAEVGVRTLIVPNLHSTLALWLLDLDSELLFVGDAGTTEASRPSRRYGVEFANYYTPKPWLTLDADFSWSHARFTDSDPAGDHIPGAVEGVIAAGISVHELKGWYAGLRIRYFGPRALVEDDSVRSSSSTLLYAHLGYEFNDRWAIGVQVFNLLDSQVDDIAYYYTSRLPGEPAEGVDDKHFHPAEPRTFRVVACAKF
jgi:outer membrane receptor protein involved in Fe transport